MKQTALIFGITGQDGAYLSRHLIDLGYLVYGVSRHTSDSDYSNLRIVDTLSSVTILEGSILDFRSIQKAIEKVKPQEIYNLAGPSSISYSLAEPASAFNSQVDLNVNILEAIRLFSASIRYFSAGSSECFGRLQKESCDEDTQFDPETSYAAAKAASFWLTRIYRESYGLFACSGIMSNHESPLRSETYVSQKIVTGAVEIHRGQRSKLELGNLEAQRDWGWAPEYVATMHTMLQQGRPSDYVIATGKSHTVMDFARLVFEEVGLNWRDHVYSSTQLRRSTDPLVVRLNPEKARKELGWIARHTLQDIAHAMVEAKQST